MSSNFDKSLEKILEVKISYRFRDISLLRTALTHKSFANESKHSIANNEKLEFLGDAVLDLVLSDHLMKLFPKDQEGGLSKKRASLVNEEVLARIAINLDLAKHILLGRGEVAQSGSQKPRLLASTLEAIVGAIFLDSNYEVVAEILKNIFESSIEQLSKVEDFEMDFKTRLQEITQPLYHQSPSYEVIEEIGPPHDRQFKVAVRVQDKVYQGQGRSKKSAEQLAAQAALADRTIQANLASPSNLANPSNKPNQAKSGDAKEESKKPQKGPIRKNEKKME